MMNRSVQHGCEQLMNLTEDGTKEQVREQEITKIREILSRQDNRDPERTKRIVQGPLSHRWWRRLNLDETFRAPSHFTWRY